MARGQRVIGRDLTPENRSAATFLHRIMLAWKSEDPLERSILKDVDIVALIQKKTGVKIPRSTLSSWKSGVRIPSVEYIKPLSEFFEVDPAEMANAFGHEYKPLVTYRDIYDQTRLAIEEWKQGKKTEEDWSEKGLTVDPSKPITHEWILSQLVLYTDPEWVRDIPASLKRMTDYVLEADASLQEKALVLCTHTITIEMFKQISAVDGEEE
jgi:hypothetical protein